MSEKLKPGPIDVDCVPGFKEAVCIQTDKVYDSCREKDCLEDLRVYFTRGAQEVIDRGINVKCRKSEIIWIFTDVEPVPFNKGYYTVDVKFFFKITLDVFTNIGTPTEVEGLATFDKKVILFGSEGNAKIFQSEFKEDAFDPQLWKKTNMPKAKVEVVDPICLNARILDIVKPCHHDVDLAGIPECVCKCFDDELVAGADRRVVLVTLGLFSIVKIERNVQLLIPAFDFCVPDKECIAATDDDPCQLFEKIKFPVDEFFPPQIFEFAGARDAFTYKTCKED